MRQSNVAKGLAIFVAGGAVLWLFRVPDGAGRCEAHCFLDMVGLLVTGAVMIANLAVAGSTLIPGAGQYAKRSGAAVAALWALGFAFAYVQANDPKCMSNCPPSNSEAMFALAMLIADVVLVGIIFVEGARLAEGFRSSEVRTVTFSRFRGFAVFGWGLSALGDFVKILGGRGDGLTLLALLGTAAIAIWLATVQLAGAH